MRMRIMRALAVGVLLSLCGCSHFHERYIFRAGRPGQANYYRVKLDGFTAFTSSQFAAGLYDAEAVDALFGELTGPGKRISVDSTTLRSKQSGGTDVTTTTTTTTNTESAMVNASPKQTTAETLGGKSLKDQKFVFFLSSNADFFVNQIQTYVTTERMQTAVVTLLLKDDLQKLELAKLDGAAADARATALGNALSASATPLGTGAESKAGEVRKAALDVLAALASRATIASPPSFATAKEAEEWLRDHPRAFRLDGGRK